MILTADKLLDYLFTRANKEYKEFIDTGIGNRITIGVTIPVLRQISKEIAKGDWRTFIKDIKPEYYEERLIYGMVIGYAKADVEEILKYLDEFVPYINSWAVCDSVVNTLKIIKKHQDTFWEYIKKYLESNNEFEIRFAVVILLSYFINDKYIDNIYLILDNINHEGYYVKMAIAWAISFCYIKYPNKTFNYLQENNLDKFTYKKAIQKTIESFRVSEDHKIKLKHLRQNKLI